MFICNECLFKLAGVTGLERCLQIYFVWPLAEHEQPGLTCRADGDQLREKVDYTANTKPGTTGRSYIVGGATNLAWHGSLRSMSSCPAIKRC